jgi:hypothetical protein
MGHYDAITQVPRGKRVRRGSKGLNISKAGSGSHFVGGGQ